jgi:hypothetical protein
MLVSAAHLFISSTEHMLCVKADRDHRSTAIFSLEK